MNKRINGKKEGCWEFYWHNSNLYFRDSYKGGKPYGYWEYFDEDGAPSHQTFYY